MDAVQPILEGFLIEAGLVVTIGAQNAFLLRQGLKRENLFLVSVVSALCNATLLFIGINGLGSWLSQNRLLMRAAGLGGAVFLCYYGLKSFREATNLKRLDPSLPSTRDSKRTIALQSVAFSFLNPHAILDLVVVIGSVGAQYAFLPRQFFLLGAVGASFVWFVLLSFAAALMAPVLQKPVVWRGIDIGVGISMWAIAVSLIRSNL